VSVRFARFLLVCAAVAGGAWACGEGGAGPDVGPADTVGDVAADEGADVAADEGADVAAPGTVVLNEIFAQDGLEDWIELANPGDAAVDIGGWALTDSDPTHVFVFAAGAQLGPKAHLLLVRDPVEGFDFGLSPDDSVVLYDAKGAQVDRAVWAPGALIGARSYGRIPSATGAFTVLATPTPGEANVANAPATCGEGGVEVGEVCDGAELGGQGCDSLGLGAGTLACAADCQGFDAAGCAPLEGSVRINEVESGGTDRIELHNTGGAAASLEGYVISDAGGNSYAFDAGASIAPGGYRVLVGMTDHTFGLGVEDTLVLEDGLGKVMDTVRWTAYQATVSYCRRPNGTGAFEACAKASFGAANP
jgi:hypothetical protein